MRQDTRKEIIITAIEALQVTKKFNQRELDGFTSSEAFALGSQLVQLGKAICAHAGHPVTPEKKEATNG